MAGHCRVARGRRRETVKGGVAVFVDDMDMTRVYPDALV
jgi:hypothetical protein